MTNLVKLTDETDEDVVRHFKLINGDDILGRLEFITTVDNESLHIITDPLIMDDWVDVKTGQSGMVLNVYCPFNSWTYLEIPSSKIVVSYPVHPVVKEYYNNSVLYNKKASTKVMEQLIAANEILKATMEPEAPVNPHVHRGTGTVN